MNTIDNMKTIVFLDLPYAGTSGTCGYCGMYSNAVLAKYGWMCECQWTASRYKTSRQIAHLTDYDDMQHRNLNFH
ncbi:hypothetical protein T08_9485 [Trichinella sp. T8]|nr:hypothetical protein T08_9485 [Trichinella sp. T8]